MKLRNINEHFMWRAAQLLNQQSSEQRNGEGKFYKSHYTIPCALPAPLSLTHSTVWFFSVLLWRWNGCVSAAALGNQDEFHKEAWNHYWKAVAEVIPGEEQDIENMTGKKYAEKKLST